MVKHTSGLVCVAIEPTRCQELNLPQMVASQEVTTGQESASCAFAFV
jgi:3,4-dihydroxy-2-butanone 4-phosphate synthase